MLVSHSQPFQMSSFYYNSPDSKQFGLQTSRFCECIIFFEVVIIVRTGRLNLDCLQLIINILKNQESFGGLNISDCPPI